MIVVDSDNYAVHGVETMFFPGGEPHVKIPKFDDSVLLFLKARTWEDTTFGALFCNAVIRQDKYVRAFIPYFPAARQDKSDGTAPLTVDLVVGLFLFGDITTFDIHSDDSRRIIESWAMTHKNLMPSQLKGLSTDYTGVIAPDKGAVNRAQDFQNAFMEDETPLILCSKERDPKTGKLSNYVMPEIPKAGKWIVVDDICDGGGTFNLLAEAWKKDPKAKDSELELFVSHGIFSKGIHALDPVYKRITTTDSWCRIDPRTVVGKSLDFQNRLTVIPLLPQLERFLT